MISFRVDGIPAPKGSFRIAHKRNRRGFVVRKDSPKTEAWHEAVVWAARAAMAGRQPIHDVPLSIRLTFYLPRPARTRRARPMVKPDLDKLIRATLDPLEGIVLDNDSRVVELIAAKAYAVTEEGPGCALELTVAPA